MYIVQLFFSVHVFNYIVAAESPKELVEEWNNGLYKFCCTLDPVIEQCLKKIYYFHSLQPNLKFPSALALFRFGLAAMPIDEVMACITLTRGLFPSGVGVVGIDGPTNCCKDFLNTGYTPFNNAFSYERESFINCAILLYFLKNNMPLSTLHGLCYGSQTLLYTLHALASEEKRAMDIKETLGIDKDMATRIINNIALCIFQAPLFDNEYAVSIVAKNIINSLALMVLANSSVRVIQETYYGDFDFDYRLFYSIGGLTLYGASDYLSRIAAPQILKLSWYKKETDNTKKLLYDLRNSQKFKHTVFAVNWHKYDPQVKPIDVELLNILDQTGRCLFACGSNEAFHVHTTKQQLVVFNYARKEAQVPYDKFILNEGACLWGTLAEFHKQKDWAGLKKYTEQSIPAL